MKCLLIASESAEVLFHWTDPEFQQNIQEQYGASQEEGEGVRRKKFNRWLPGAVRMTLNLYLLFRPFFV